MRALGVPGTDAAPLDPRLPDEARVEEAEVLAQQETHARVEVLLRFDEVRRGRERRTLVADAGAEGSVVDVDARALATAPVAVELEELGWLELEVEAVEVLRSRSGGVALREDRADAGALTDVAFHPGDREGGLRHAVVSNVRRSRTDAEDAEVPFAEPTGQASPQVHRHGRAAVEPDAAREEGLHQGGQPGHSLGRAELEDARVLEEEVPLLGEEEGEPRQVHLQIVDLDLGEVRVVGEIEYHRLARSPLDVESAVEIVRRRTGRRLFRGGTDQVGLDVQTARAPKPGEPRQAAGQGNAVGRVVGHAGRGDRQGGTGQIRPVHLFALAANEPLDVEPPAIERRIEAQGREGNGHLGRPAVRRSSSPDRPDAVPLGVHVASLVGDQRIVTGTVRVGSEGEGVPAVEERVEDQNEGVVGGKLRVALHLLGDDPRGLPIERAQGDVERRRGVGDGELRAFGCRCPLTGFALAKAVADLGLLPGRLIEPAIDDDRLVDDECPDRGTLRGGVVVLTDRRCAES